MRVLVCAQEYYPHGSGIATVAHFVVEALRKKGVECVVLSPTGPDIRLGDEATINRWAGLGLLRFWGTVRAYLKEHAAEYDAVWLHNPLFLRRIDLPNAVSTVHTTYDRYFSLYRHSPIPAYHKAYYWLMRLLERKCYRKNRFLSTTVSPEVRKELTRLGIPKRRSFYVPNGVDTKMFSPTVKHASLPTPKDTTVLLYVGRFEYQKDIPALIKVVRRAHELRDDIHLVCAGDGSLLAQAKEDAKGAPFIHFLGRVPHDTLPGLYAAAHYYIMSSIYEGQPTTILEAMSAGLPCVLNDIPNLSHLVKEAPAGLVLDFSDTEKTAQAIAEKCTRTSSRKARAAMRKHAVAHYDWDAIAEQYIALFEKVRR